MPSLRIDVVTLFPQFFQGPLQESILKRAQKENQVEINVHNLRDFTHDKHKTADDKPFGGGAGMVMKPEPIFECVESLPEDRWVVMMSPAGDRLTQRSAKRLSRKKHIVLIATGVNQDLQGATCIRTLLTFHPKVKNL